MGHAVEAHSMTARNLNVRAIPCSAVGDEIAEFQQSLVRAQQELRPWMAMAEIAIELKRIRRWLEEQRT